MITKSHFSLHYILNIEGVFPLLNYTMLEESENPLVRDQGHSSICFVFLIHDIDDFVLTSTCQFG